MISIFLKKGNISHKILIRIILTCIIFVVFFGAMANKFENRDVKRQVLEKELALLIDSAEPGMSFEIAKYNANGYIENIEITNGKIFVTIDGYRSGQGYPYFSKYHVFVDSEEDKFLVRIDER